ncbi:putative late blight resistance protein-like protein R1A-10 [Forsythia ovata]|uniref:Late blight resistance protein-like protein R1A-10 n=1 Tax=Forsythia ovata TaxID=205694 RepID=A0ABD1TSF5_9LAMI
MPEMLMISNGLLLMISQSLTELATPKLKPTMEICEDTNLIARILTTLQEFENEDFHQSTTSLFPCMLERSEMAYAALLSLAHILEQTLNHDFKYLIAHRILSESASNGDNRFTVIGRELEKLIEEIDSIKKQVTKIQVESGVQDLQQGISLPVGSSKPASSGKSTLVGLDDDLMDIKTRLVGESSELETISVVGMGGIGKTTLARKVYDDDYIVYHFYIRAWVTVSQGYNVRQILLDLLDSMKKLTNQMCEENSEQLAEILYKNLKGMRYLIIMDDVWDANVWDDVKRSFPNDKNGSRIMLTTRLRMLLNMLNLVPLFTT